MEYNATQKKTNQKYMWDEAYLDVFSRNTYIHHALAYGIANAINAVRTRRSDVAGGRAHMCVRTKTTLFCNKPSADCQYCKSRRAYAETNYTTASSTSVTYKVAVSTTTDSNTVSVPQTSPSPNVKPTRRKRLNQMTLSFKKDVGETVHYVKDPSTEYAAIINSIDANVEDGPDVERLDTVSLIVLGDGVKEAINAQRCGIEHSADGHKSTWHRREECQVVDEDEDDGDTPEKKK